MLKGWLKEYYPVEADSAKAKKDPIGHSLRKWTGLLKGNMKRHKLDQGWRSVEDNNGETLEIGGDTCALCTLYYDADECTSCPLANILGKRCDDGEYSPYRRWLSEGTARPMVNALRRAQKKFGKGAKRA